MTTPPPFSLARLARDFPPVASFLWVWCAVVECMVILDGRPPNLDWIWMLLASAPVPVVYLFWIVVFRSRNNPDHKKEK